MFLCFSCLCCFSPFRFVLRLFSHELEGADPSSYEAYPQAIAPALRPSEGQGGGIILGRLDTPFGIHFSLLCVWQRVTGTPRAFFSGEGALSLPPQALFHTHLSFASRPRFFFVFFFFSLSLFAGPWGPELDSLTRYPSPIDDGVFSVFLSVKGGNSALTWDAGEMLSVF